MRSSVLLAVLLFTGCSSQPAEKQADREPEVRDQPREKKVEKEAAFDPAAPARTLVWLAGHGQKLLDATGNGVRKAAVAKEMKALFEGLAGKAIRWKVPVVSVGEPDGDGFTWITLGDLGHPYPPGEYRRHAIAFLNDSTPFPPGKRPYFFLEPRRLDRDGDAVAHFRVKADGWVAGLNQGDPVVVAGTIRRLTHNDPADPLAMLRFIVILDGSSVEKP